MPFSVLMSLYAKERPEFLRQSLDSVFKQTLMADEVVLVEDGPLTKELYAVVDEYSLKHSELKIIPLPVNGGLGHALNEGIKHCGNDLIARMDTDDIAKSDRFEKQVSFMRSHPDIDGCSAWIEEFIGDIENIVSVKKLPETNDDIYKFGKSRCPINHPAVIYRKKAVIECGGYGPFPEDYYLWGRMLTKGFKLHNLQESLLYFRSSENVYKRRGGWNYYKAMLKLQKELHRISYTSYPEYLRNITIRTIVALIPNSLRAFIYKKFLRTKA
ncbi:MAG: glycosyltransferase [Muribaculum sp.]|nr:glycosyltransferase [Muribaculum sp.]